MFEKEPLASCCYSLMYTSCITKMEHGPYTRDGHQDDIHVKNPSAAFSNCTVQWCTCRHAHGLVLVHIINLISYCFHCSWSKHLSVVLITNFLSTIIILCRTFESICIRICLIPSQLRSIDMMDRKTGLG